MGKLNLKKSDFQMVYQRISKINFSIKEDIKKSLMEANLEVGIHKEKKNEAKVKMNLKIDEKVEKGIGYSIELEIEGFFEWSGEEVEKNIETLLSINAPATLISYVRTSVAQLSTNAGFPALVLPLINFSKSKKV